MKKYVIILIVFTFFSLGKGTDAQAQTDGDIFSEIGNQLGAAGVKTTLSKTDPRNIVGVIINAFLGLLGTIFLVLLVYGGYLWMTAAGNEEDVTKAKKLITQAVIGLAIVMGAYAITAFVTQSIVRSTAE